MVLSRTWLNRMYIEVICSCCYFIKFPKGLMSIMKWIIWFYSISAWMFFKLLKIVFICIWKSNFNQFNLSGRQDNMYPIKWDKITAPDDTDISYVFHSLCAVGWRMCESLLRIQTHFSYCFSEFFKNIKMINEHFFLYSSCRLPRSYGSFHI